MKHIARITRLPAPAQFDDVVSGQLDLAETLVLLLLTAFFQDWLNFPTVLQNLRKYYSKT